MSYLNTKPLLHGLAVSGVANDINLSVDYPSKLARQLRDDELDVALLPVAAIPEIPNARIISDDRYIVRHTNVKRMVANRFEEQTKFVVEGIEA